MTDDAAATFAGRAGSLDLVTAVIERGMAFLEGQGAKLIKYVAVAIIGVPIGLFVYFLFLRFSGWGAAASNAAATMVMVIPNYLMNRYFVWQKTTKNSLSGEVLPFWIMAFIGFAFSTVAAWFADGQGASDFILLGVNLLSFGIVWVFKFFVLERFLFGKNTAEPAEPAII